MNIGVKSVLCTWAMIMIGDRAIPSCPSLVLDRVWSDVHAAYIFLACVPIPVSVQGSDVGSDESLAEAGVDDPEPSS